MTIENRIPSDRPAPEWAQRERQHDLAWIGENIALFQLAVTATYEEVGRGAIVVDTTAQPLPDSGHPFGYVGQGEIERSGDEDTIRLVREYDPANQELVVMLLKPFNRTSTYRLQARPRQDRETRGGFS
jgi:hypothetical protein